MPSGRSTSSAFAAEPVRQNANGTYDIEANMESQHGLRSVFYAETRPPVLWTGKTQFGRVLICVWTGLDG